MEGRARSPLRAGVVAVWIRGSASLSAADRGLPGLPSVLVD